MKLFFDTNVLLDVLQQREGFVADSATVLSKCVAGVHTGMFSALSACNMVYILHHRFSREWISAEIQKLAEILEMHDTRAAEVKAALAGDDSDFEDAVQRICAEDNGADVIITRDKDGFANATIPVLTPTDFLSSDFMNRAE